MAKVVDHEQRRRRITDAVRRITADRGLEAVSLSQVATEAGISKGQVQHYFPTKDAMLRHALSTLHDGVEHQVGAESAGSAPTLRTVLLALLPVDDDARAQALVANAFLWRALKDDDIAAQFRVGYRQVHDGLVALMKQEQDLGALPPDLDLAQEADLLAALTTGLADAVLLGHRNVTQATELIDAYLRRLGARDT